MFLSYFCCLLELNLIVVVQIPIVLLVCVTEDKKNCSFYSITTEKQYAYIVFQSVRIVSVQPFSYLGASELALLFCQLCLEKIPFPLICLCAIIWNEPVPDSNYGALCIGSKTSIHYCKCRSVHDAHFNISPAIFLPGYPKHMLLSCMSVLDLFILKE